MVFLEGVVDTTLDEMDSSYIHTHTHKKKQTQCTHIRTCFIPDFSLGVGDTACT